MKKIMTIVFFAVAVFTAVDAQQQSVSIKKSNMPIRLNVYTDYVFDNNIDSRYDNNNYFTGKINGGFQWGAGLEFILQPEYGIELTYLRQDTKIPLVYLNGSGSPKRKDFNVGINYIMIGSNRYFGKPGSMVEGFGGLSVGAVVLGIKNPDAGGSSTKTKFAWDARIGANIWATKRVGIKLQAQLASAIQSISGGIFIGSGGSGVGLSSNSTIYQFSLGGGLVFKLTN